MFGEPMFHFDDSKQNHDGVWGVAEGYLIAHDIVEHARLKDIGTVRDELMALGGIWYVRGQFGEISRSPRGNAVPTHDAIAHELVTLSSIQADKKNRLNVSRISECGYEDDFNDIVNIAKPKIVSELECYDMTRNEIHNFLDSYLEDSRRLMVAGFNHAHKRYKRVGGATKANTIFWNIAEEFDRFVRYEDFWEGQQIALHVNFTTASVKVKRVHDEYNDY